MSQKLIDWICNAFFYKGWNSGEEIPEESPNKVPWTENEDFYFCWDTEKGFDEEYCPLVWSWFDADNRDLLFYYF